MKNKNFDITNYVDFILEKTKEVLAIDSPTGYTKKCCRVCD